MARIIRSPRAKQDIVNVLRYTKEHWGEAQAREYRDLVKEALIAIALDPRCGKARDELRPGIRGHHIKQPGRNARHILFYRVTADDAVQVVRFLHDSMDFDQHLG
jgi:toxin ParE1/3/4